VKISRFYCTFADATPDLRHHGNSRRVVKITTISLLIETIEKMRSSFSAEV